jgi:hypothetical protein
MASQGPYSPGSTFVESALGSVVWDSPDNVKVDDTNYATASSAVSGFTKILKAYNFGFSIPSDSRISGIKAEVKKKAETENVTDSWVILTGGSNLSTGAEWPAVEQYVTYGGETELWGASYAPEYINDPRFGFRCGALLGINATASINHIRLTVYYTSTKYVVYDDPDMQYVEFENQYVIYDD